MSFLSNNTTQKSTILITGGGTGIGLALSQRLIALGHTVIAAGRRQSALDEAKAANPKLKTVQGDVGSDAGRLALFQKVTKEFPEVNVLINNAGVMGGAASLKDTTAADWEGHKQTIETNLVGTIHLSILFVPFLIEKANALIVVNSSILGFFPYAQTATYSATKGSFTPFLIIFSVILTLFLLAAALHSFTISLRHQLKDTSIKVRKIVYFHC
jgi:uncharacterized oxidoreductase